MIALSENLTKPIANLYKHNKQSPLYFSHLYDNNNTIFIEVITKYDNEISTISTN